MRWHLAADQTLVSLSSIALLVSAAQGLGVEDLGYFVFAVSTVTLGISIIRSFTGESLVASAREYSDHMGKGAMAMAMILAIAAAAIFALVAAIFPEVAVSFMGAAVAIVPLVLYDTVRFSLIASGRDRKVLVLGFLVLISQTASVAFVSIFYSSVFLTTVAWGAVPAIATVATLLRYGEVRPSFKDMQRWIGAHASRSSAYASETAIGALNGYAVNIALIATIGPTALAIFRGIISIFGATSALTSYVRSAMVRDLSIGGTVDRSVLRRSQNWTLLFATAFCVVTAVIAYILPRQIGVSLLGDLWLALPPFLLLGAVNRVLAATSTTPAMILRSKRASWKPSGIRIAIVVLSSPIIVFSSATHGVAGALASEAVMYLALWIVMYVYARRLLD